MNKWNLSANAIQGFIQKNTFGCLLILLVLFKLLYVIFYASNQSDSDQILFALMSKDYSQGIFHAPLVYGQAYNFPYESWLAVPLLWAQIPWYTALPLVTSFMGIMPFIFISLLFKREGKKYAAEIVLIAGILLCPNWHYLTTIPRGFTGSIFMLSACVYFYIISKNNMARMVAILISIWVVLLSPNHFILLCIFPFFPGMKMQQLKDDFIRIIISLGIAILTFYIWNIQLTNESGNWIHPSPVLLWKFENVWFGMVHLPEYLYGLGPVSPGLGLIWILLFIYAIFYHFKQHNTLKALSAILFLLAMVISFGFNKVLDGSTAQDLPYARFWLAIPVAGILIFADMLGEKKNYPRIQIIALFVVASLQWWLYLNQNKDRELACKTVEIYERKNVVSSAEWLKSIRLKHNCKLVLIADIGQFTYLNPIYDRQGDYFYPMYERKFWIKNHYDSIFPKNLIYAHRDVAFTPRNTDNFHCEFIDSLNGIKTYFISENRLTGYKFKEWMQF